MFKWFKKLFDKRKPDLFFYVSIKVDDSELAEAEENVKRLTLAIKKLNREYKKAEIA